MEIVIDRNKNKEFFNECLVNVVILLCYQNKKIKHDKFLIVSSKNNTNFIEKIAVMS